ncbi:MAG: bifunctional metallophosphatase/5'-nucleotidase [Acidobacteria bacterium]|nr:bifunctional metallophosphatase/5'-nucleotidase [Acidobacteriota bacterium]
MKRRDFIKGMGLLAGTTAVARPMDWLFPRKNTLHIIHTNDLHSHIDPFPKTDRRYPGMGGYARRATLFKELRNRYQNTLFVDAGDVFQGTPYFNYYEGKLDYELMSKLGYEIGTLGNHDFDNGVDKLLAAMQKCNFAMVNANYAVTNPLLRNRLKPYTIVHRANSKIGVFGLGVTFRGLVTPDHHLGLEYTDPVATAKRTVQQLRDIEHCDMAICLSHLGIDGASGEPGDIQLAEQVEGIDVIIGGHSHTFMDSPMMVSTPSGWTTLIHQVGWAGIWVGHIKVVIGENGKIHHKTAVHYGVG